MNDAPVDHRPKDKNPTVFPPASQPVCKAFYMVALVGSRANAVLRERYETFRARGKPAKVALVALMRHLVIHLNALLKTPKLLPPKTVACIDWPQPSTLAILKTRLHMTLKMGRDRKLSIVRANPCLVQSSTELRTNHSCWRYGS